MTLVAKRLYLTPQQRGQYLAPTGMGEMGRWGDGEMGRGSRWVDKGDGARTNQ